VIKTSTDKTEASLQRYKELLEQKLKDVAQAVAYTAAKSFVQHTPVGHPETGTRSYLEAYKTRERTKGYRIEGGLARGSWVLSLNNQVNHSFDNYDQEGTKTLTKAQSSLQSIKLGDVIIINNSLDYISDLDAGSSNQAPDGIRLPAIEQIKQASKLDIQRVLTETKFK
jgi:hypothetical protein